MKNYYLIALLGGVLITTQTQATTPSKTILADDFKVYHSEKVGLATKNFKGATEATVPTDNEYKENPGCYIACYSKSATDAAYKLYDKTYMMGQIRVPGRYTNGFCMPKGFEHKDVRKSKELRESCEKSFPTKCEKESCWADPHTSNWFY